MTSKLPLKADHVGSFLRTDPVKQARASYANGEINRAALREVEDQEIEKLVKKQIDVGLKAITDGDFRRSFWHLDFFVSLKGIEKVEIDRGLQFADGIEVRRVSYEIKDKIEFDENNALINDFLYLNDLVKKYGDGTQVAKVTIPAPGVIFYRNVTEDEKKVYADARALFRDLGKAYREVIRQLYNAGCRYIQFDETTLTTFADENFVSLMTGITDLSKEEVLQLIIDATNYALEDKPADLLVSVHMCRGNFKSKHIHADGGYDYVAPSFDKLKYDAFFLEYDNERSGDFKPLENIQRRNAEVVLGVFTSKFPELEDEDVINRRIKEASQYIPLENIALSPQCGFASTEEGNILTEEEQWNKVKHIIQIAENVWDKASIDK
ncbi:5-methyltetrahydropteroyltriglutamate--homocysteine S-methyltransferase [Oceanobacillus sp. FSL W8-0428]|uniref:5-methyltetrahydropteroyltriglutamate-- homocysteine S-methyltransferase n=1 Tax=Oceanobacillus TaxID=182709 RepID=UPI0030DBB021